MGKASTLFNGAGKESLISRITPTQKQRDFLQEHWNALADHLKTELRSSHGYPVFTWIQGSYKYATLIRPVRKGEEYDVDLGVHFEWPEHEENPPSARAIREWVQDELEAYAQEVEEIISVANPPKERCSRTTYRNHFHIDTPVYHANPETNTSRLATWGGSWEDRDPEPLHNWFRDAVHEDVRDQFRRVVRYLKAWAAVAFEGLEGSRPSSVMLMVMTANAFAKHPNWVGAPLDDDDALSEVVSSLVEVLISGDAQVLNPVDEGEDLNRIPESGWQRFEERLQSLADASARAQESDDVAGAALAWSDAFSYLMPLPEADEVEIVKEGSGTAVMTVPDILIQVFRKPREFVTNFTNDVPRVLKGSMLEFSIAQVHLVPHGATVEWTVRNADDEAESIGDLGHRRLQSPNEVMTEEAKYAGRHYMDCVIRLGRSVVSVRRVSVTISGTELPLRNPPKPAYVKLRSRR